MNELIQFAQAHYFWLGVGLYWVFSALVSALPDPTSTSGIGYTVFYKFMHTIAGNISTAVAGKIPGGTQ